MNVEHFKKQMGAIDGMVSRHQTIELDEEQEPKLSSWKVGQSYDLKVKGKLIELTEDEEGMRGTFEIVDKEKPEVEEED